MNAREFFDSVVEMRKHQKAYARSYGRDKLEARYARDAEARIDKEITRVKLLLREQMQNKLDL